MRVSYTAKCIGGQEARIVQIDFSAAIDMVNHQGILYKPCSVGIGGSVLSILTTRQCFGPIIVPPVHLGAFLHFDSCCAIPRT